MHWENLYWMVIKDSSNSDVLPPLCDSGSGKRNKRQWDILKRQEGSGPTSSPLPVVYDSSRGITFSHLERERDYAEEMLNLLVQKKRFWEADACWELVYGI